MREAATYRGARRNAYRGLVWPTSPTKRQHLPLSRLNRSKKWPVAYSYAQARASGPSGEPVR